METLTDEIPFAETKSEPQLIIAIVQGRSPSDASSLSSYAKELKVLLVDCWSRQPSKRPTAVDCLRIVECAIPTPEQKADSIAELPSPSLPPPFVPCTAVPARAITRGGFISPNGSNLSIATRQHSLKEPRHRPSGVTSSRNGARWNHLQQRHAIQVDHTRQPNQNGIKMLHQAQVISQQPNQLTNGNGLLTRTDPSLAANPPDDTELLGSQSSSRLRIPKEAVISAWSFPPYVLLVDDDIVSRRVFIKFLEISGCTIDVAVDGLDAVSKMESDNYDLVLMDIIMPNLDGISATSLIRQFDNSTPIISMTSECKPNDILVYYTNGMNDILPKPFTQKELFAMLEKHLEHLKATTMAQAAAKEPSQDLSGEWCSSTPNLLDTDTDGMNCLRLLDSIGGLVVADPAGSAEGVLNTAGESKRPHLEAV
ncbi:kinase-regulated stress-responsive transcription factor skn7 [Tulasnella sp. 425]|nr:kinase-regulated stress-responsive transcription factor skn7 [Tulasnella sp. 425]